MEVKRYKSEVTNPMRRINPVDVIKDNCSRLDFVLKYIGQLKPKRVNDYVFALEKRLRKDSSLNYLAKAVLRRFSRYDFFSVLVSKKKK